MMPSNNEERPDGPRSEAPAAPSPRAVISPPTFSVALRDVVREVPGAALVSGDPASLVTGVHHDSRRVEAGDIFVARRGGRVTGVAFIGEAVARGARAVIVERESSVTIPAGVARIEVEDGARALAYASAAVYGHPTFSLEVVGITGTNGKTTTAYLTRAFIDAAGGRCGIVGTLGAHFENLDVPSVHTSPEADELARIAASMRARGATHLVMEVSSIALAAARADAVSFRVAAFTNLTQDHLDYHGGMEAYAAAKERLFTDLSPGASVINVADGFGQKLADTLVHRAGSLSAAHVTRYTAEIGAPADHAEVAPTALRCDASGIAVDVRTPRGALSIASPLLGAHNVSNLLCAVAIATRLELDLAAVARALSTTIAIPGRLERCDDPRRDDVVALVDYAHTPDALERVLGSVRGLGTGRIVCVFGCGGDRDPGKRPLMGAAVARAADLAIVTNDNPRSEDPVAIADAIVAGMGGGHGKLVVELDRARAIEQAIMAADPGDVVVIAGKGHEPYQIIGDRTFPFDDRDQARRALELRRAPGGRR
jgi:UDP-N-acetylmuramoyl-L-alanyl-D-glutamate--2,6-diaminopimelate ligase